MYAKLTLVLVCLLARASHQKEFLPKLPALDNAHLDYLGKAPDDLQYAFIIFRHGIRSPFSADIYPSEDEYAHQWPDGKQQLTQLGKKLMERVGRSLKTRYKRLIPEFHKDYVEVTATKSPRAKQSAVRVVEGMYPTPDNVKDITKTWVKEEEMKVFEADNYEIFDDVEGHKSCRRYTLIKNEIIKEEMKKLSYGKSRLIKALNKLMSLNKVPATPIKTLDEFFNVWDAYEMTYFNGKKVPVWVAPMLESLTDIAQYRLWMRMHGKTDNGDSILQYYTGPLLNQIALEAVHAEEKCKRLVLERKRGEDRKTANKCASIHLHGSHDLTVGALMWALVEDTEFIAKPGDTLIIEIDSESKIKAYLYSPLTPLPLKNFKQLSLKNVCKKKSCGLFNFIEVMKQRGLMYSKEAWEEQCSKEVLTTDKLKWRDRKSNFVIWVLKRIFFLYFMFG
ncbi:prostatic acid phosphatase-like [Macrosteles quadrilineatus]|uniref:prostatic acid phosphatase-like n=1 Tax=Macrosteles quadrilineatus TaxID=74068 RepID=UPI0023E26B86|nr:prostatic acid phosphatase-like [Macrosteles quadrilineatus]